MYVSEQHKAIYVASSRTGSESISKWFQDHYGACKRPANCDHHHVEPCLDNAYTVFMSVRDPFRRVISQWAGDLWYWSKSSPLEVSNFEWWFSKASKLSKREGLVNPLPPRLVDFHNATKRVGFRSIQLIHNEKMITDLAQLPFVTQPMPLPESVNTKGLSFGWQYFYRKREIVDRVREHYADDFLWYGYSPEIAG